MRNHTVLALTAALALSLGTIGMGARAAAPHSTAPTIVQTRTVVAGFGDQDGATNVYAPRVIDIYAGDTIAWRVGGLLEPHTITFGPPALLQQLATHTILPVPQREGPPRIVLNPRIAFPTQVTSYEGSGYANSGVLHKGQIWRLTFPTPGTYRYHCLLHFPGMAGTVVVHPRPTTSMTVYHVVAGDSGEQAHRDTSAASDLFFPRHLTIHVGDTVVWTGGFHTITFGPDAQRQYLEKHLFIPQSGPGRQPELRLNPQAVLPAGGTTYDGSGFANSGLLLLRAGKNAPPTYTLTFTKAGEFEYDCLIHPGMDGTITVLPAAN